MAFIHLIFILLHWLQGINSIELPVCPTDPKSTSQPGKNVLEQRATGWPSEQPLRAQVNAKGLWAGRPSAPVPAPYRIIYSPTPTNELGRGMKCQ